MEIIAIYGPHGDKDYLDLIQSIESIIEENSINIKKIIVFLENSINDIAYFNKNGFNFTDNEVESFLKNKEEIENNFLRDIKHLDEPKLKNKGYNVNILGTKLMLYLTKKNIQFKIEKISCECFKKFLSDPAGQKRNQNQAFRDECFANQISNYNIKGYDYVLIIRGYEHTNLSKLLSDKGYHVKDYKYGKWV